MVAIKPPIAADLKLTLVFGRTKYKNRNILQQVSGPRGYHLYHENWVPSEESEEVDTTALREKFVQHKYDDRLDAGLPHAYKAYTNMKRSAVDQQIDEFSESLDMMSEGTWAMPDNDLAVKDLIELMSAPLEAGVDGNNATGALYDILGDDVLFDRIYDASTGSPEMDVRPIVADWLESNMPSVHAKVMAAMQDGGEEEAEEQPEPAPAPAPPPPAPEAPPEQQDPNAAQQQPPAEGDPNAPAAGAEDQQAQQPPQDPSQPPPPPTESVLNHGKMLADIRRLAGLR